MARFAMNHLLVAAFVLATLALNDSEATGIESIRARLKGLRHGSGHGASASGRAYAGGHDAHASAKAKARAHDNYAYGAAPAGPAYYAAPPAPVAHHGYNRYAPPVPAAVHAPAYQPPAFHFAPAPRRPVVQRYAQPPQYHPSSAGGAAASSAAAAAAGHGGAAASGSAAGASGHSASSAAAAAASSGHAHGHNHGYSAPVTSHGHVVEEENFNEHYEEPEHENTYAAQSGTYANDGLGSESSSYVRETENIDNHEDGKEDDNHYYNAHSYGKTFDENKHEAYNNDDEDVLHTPNVYRSKKSSTNYVADLNKARRESGSGVLAHDKHSASYNVNNKRFKENVDKRFNREGAGVSEALASSSAIDHSDEDEERYDSDNLGTFVGVDGVRHHKHPGFVRNLGKGAAASGSASSDGHGNGVATSSAAVGTGSAASSAGASSGRK